MTLARTPIIPQVALILCATFLSACGAAPRFRDELEAATAHLDSSRNDEAVGYLNTAYECARSVDDRVEVLAVLLETQLARDDIEEAEVAVSRMRSIAPAAFMTWKGQAVLDLRRSGTSAARAGLQAAKGRLEREGQQVWVRDFQHLLDALDAFRDGDLAAARKDLNGIGHQDVAPSAAWLDGRLDAIEQVQAQRISAARAAGLHEGLLDLWHAARNDVVTQERVAAYARQVGHDLAASDLHEVDVNTRAALLPSPLAVASLAAVARVAIAQLPLRARSMS